MDGVFHFVHCPIRSNLANTDDGVSLVKQQNGSHLGLGNNGAILVKDGLDVLLAVANPLAFNLRHVDDHHVSAGQSCELIDGLGLASARSAVHQASEAAAVVSLPHTLDQYLILLLIEKGAQLIHLLAHLGSVVQLLGCNALGLDDTAQLLFLDLEIDRSQQLGACFCG